LGRLHLHDFFNSAPNMAAARQAIGDRRREQFVLVAPGTPEPLETGALVCRGEITAANAEKIWECMHAYLMRSRSGEVWRIDLSQVRFIDSSGLGLMVRAKKLANSHAASLVFTGLTPAVRNVVHLARLGRWLLEESIHSGA
jgi:anti-anti-sigma factor